MIWMMMMMMMDDDGDDLCFTAAFVRMVG